MKDNCQMEIHKSETFLIGCILAFSGGYMDAYTYLFRGEVFANAQTGNMILFAIHMFEGNWTLSYTYTWPVAFFLLGIIVAHVLSARLKRYKELHWRQVALIFEIIILSLVGLMSVQMNLLANSMVSFACGIQVQSFRTIQGNNLATTMCIGNIRSGTDYLCSFWYTQERSFLKRSMIYFGIVSVFIIGAIFGNVMEKALGQQAIFISPVFLIIACLLMGERKTSKRVNYKETSS